MNSVSCVTQLSCVQPVTCAQNVVPNLPVGARLQRFWEIWLGLGAGPKVVQILREGYTLPFQTRPNLTRSPSVVSCYVNPLRNSYLLEALHQLIDKNAVELVHNQASLGFFNRPFLVPKPKQQMEAYFRSEQIEFFPQNGEIQNGDTGNHQDIPPARGVGHLDRFQGCLLPHTNTGTIQEISEISCPGSDIPVQGSSLWSVDSSLGVHCCSKGGEADGHTQRYKDPPVPRRLVGESQIPPGLSPAYSGSRAAMPKSWFASEFGKIGTGTQAGLRFCRLPVRPHGRSGPTDPGPLAEPSGQNTGNNVITDLSGPTIHVSDRFINSHREASSPRPTAYETHTVASQEQLANTRGAGKSYSNPKVITPPFKMVVRRGQCSHRPTLTPNKVCSANLYRRIKRRVGRSLKRAHCKGVLVSARKQAAHKLPRTKSSLFSSKRVPRPLHRPDSLGGDRQHHSGVLHKQGGRHEVGTSLRSIVEDPDLVLQEAGDSQSLTHPRSPKRGSRQAITTRTNNPNRVVPPARGFPGDLPQMAQTSNRLICYEVQQQAPSVCVPSAGPPGHSSGCSQSPMGGSGCVRLPTNSHPGQGGGEIAGFHMRENHSDCPGVAKHALVLGPSGHVQPDPTESAQSTQPANSALQSDPSQKSDKLKSPCMAPRASKIKEQGFSEAVAARIEAPQRGSTRSVYEAKWTIFTKWCLTHKVDSRAPPVQSVADFLMYLFEDRKLQPSTIDGYRSAIADKLGNSSINVSRDENLTRLLDSFHRDRPKGRRGVPSWNLSLVLHQLMKPPFEPLKEASLKHLTFKTVFLLALGSGMRRSEIHAWQNKNIRHQSDWSKVSLYPSPSFLAKNQLAKEGPDSIAPVVIPALAPTLDRSLKSDRSLCPVRALRYYLDRTSDLRQNKELVFVSFKKEFDKDISPALSPLGSSKL